jgi:mannose-6-phosphate isomerase-like protein (cupin superfamily)
MTASRYRVPIRIGEQGRSVVLDVLDQAIFKSEGPLAGNEYRELSVGQASGGALGLRHLRSTLPFEAGTGWHWHDMDVHVVYVLRGQISYRFEGVDEVVIVRAGDCLTQPAGVPHNVVGRSADLELLELTMPDRFGTFEPGPGNA